MIDIVTHEIVKELPPPECCGLLYNYLFAANGVFLHAKRPNLEVLIPVEMYQQPIKGLAAIAPYVKLSPGKIPRELLMKIWLESRKAVPNEILFHLNFANGAWQLAIPPQIQTPTSCQPLSNDRDSSFADALLEVHSHHDMPAYFSGDDDTEETGFRLYSVIGQVNNNAEIRTRVGVYGHHWTIPSSLIYEAAI